MAPGLIMVVAGALLREDGLCLMQRRPYEKHHGGLWEFPGGKVELSEMPVQSLARELEEELGVRCEAGAIAPLAFAETPPSGDGPPIVILLYSVNRWQGEPKALEGGAIGWFTPDEVMALPKPPLDVSLARQLFQNPILPANGPCQSR
jgi:8-oxo-dGTP diphosphatase